MTKLFGHIIVNDPVLGRSLSADPLMAGAVNQFKELVVTPVLDIDFTAVLDPSDPALINLTATGDLAESYVWYVECADEPVRLLGIGRTLTARVPIWGAWDITLLCQKSGYEPLKLQKLDVNGFTGNEHLFLPFDYLDTDESFAWDYMSGTVKLKGKWNSQPYCLQMIRDVTTGNGAAGELLQVGWNALNILDVAAIKAWESDLTACSVYRIYVHDTSVYNDGATQATLIETVQTDRFRVGENGVNGLPYLYLVNGNNTDIYEFEAGVNVMNSTGAQSAFLGAIFVADDVNQSMRLMATQASRGLIDTYTSNGIDMFPNNRSYTRFCLRGGDFAALLLAMYADMFDVDGRNNGQSLKARWNERLCWAEDVNRNYNINMGAPDKLFEQFVLTGNHQFFGWWAARGTGQGVFDAFERSFRRYINWRFGKSYVYDEADAWDFGALMISGFRSYNSQAGTSGFSFPSEILLPGEFTFSFWFRFEYNPLNNGAFVGTIDNANDSTIVFNNSLTNLYVQTPNGGLNMPLDHSVDPDRTYHLVVRRNASNQVFLHLDMVASSANGSSRDGVFELGNIGSRGTTNPIRYCGYGDFAVFDRCLSDEEVQAIYDAGPSAGNAPSPLLTIAPDPLVFYRFTEYNTHLIKDEGVLGYDIDLRDFNMYAHEWR